MSYKISYLTPRESLGRFLAHLENPSSNWAMMYNEDQKEYWCKRADSVLSFLKDKGLV